MSWFRILKMEWGFYEHLLLLNIFFFLNQAKKFISRKHNMKEHYTDHKECLDDLKNF